VWSFRLFGIPVRVHFWFWIAILFLGGERPLPDVLLWLGVCFVSILLHEIGHVVAFRFFRRDAEVVLYGFGGMAIPQADVIGSFPRAVVALAGPMAGFCLAALVLASVKLTGGFVFFGRYMFLPHLSAMLNPRLILSLHNPWLLVRVTMLVNDLLFVNFYWGVVNLLPVWPLDGGHVSRAILEQCDRHDGRRKSLIVSAVIAAVVALASFRNEQTWLAIMFGLLAVSSIQSLQGEQRRAIPAYRRYRE
jgi:membrane-associated protease RseP (regulator of RpoE activity)